MDNNFNARERCYLASLFNILEVESKVIHPNFEKWIKWALGDITQEQVNEATATPFTEAERLAMIEKLGGMPTEGELESLTNKLLGVKEA